MNGPWYLVVASLFHAVGADVNSVHITAVAAVHGARASAGDVVSTRGDTNTNTALGTVVFFNDVYPQCCTTALTGRPCFFRIPVVMAIPSTSVVLAFAEMRGGAAGWGCGDGESPAVALKRSTDNGATFGRLQVCTCPSQ